MQSIEIPNPLGHGGSSIRFVTVQNMVSAKLQSPGRLCLSLQGAKGGIKAVTYLTPSQARELAELLLKAATKAEE